MQPRNTCPECTQDEASVSRRDFVRTVGAATAAVAAGAVRGPVLRAADSASAPRPETLVQKLYGTLTPAQKEAVCFPWDYADDRGLLRMHVSNNWHIVEQTVGSAFFGKDQQELIEALFWGLYDANWKDRIRKQLQDDAGGYGKSQNIAIFGEPGTGKFELVMTGRHLTIRCDGDSTEHVAFGGPIFYGHAAGGNFNEKADHPGNVYWHQAQKANALYAMLDGKQRGQALIDQAPQEREVHFRAKGAAVPGLPASELSADQRKHLEEVLTLLLEPYRLSDRTEALACLKAQGGLEKCALSFYKSGDIGSDGVWDVWRLEGPSFVWHWRGSPHVHVWVHVADDPSVKITTRG
jgi:hypothetical protein